MDTSRMVETQKSFLHTLLSFILSPSFFTFSLRFAESLLFVKPSVLLTKSQGSLLSQSLQSSIENNWLGNWRCSKYCNMDNRYSVGTGKCCLVGLELVVGKRISRKFVCFLRPKGRVWYKVGTLSVIAQICSTMLIYLKHRDEDGQWQELKLKNTLRVLTIKVS